MTADLVCPQGHRWASSASIRAATGRPGDCPVCGAAPVRPKKTISLSEAETLPPSQAAVEPAVLSGRFGRYRILKRLGQGGMGSVYLAHDAQLDRPVALQGPHFAPDEGAEAVERFYEEARTAATLLHPNICPVYEVGQVEDTPYLTMAF